MSRFLIPIILFFSCCDNPEPSVPSQLVRVVVDSIPQFNGMQQWDPLDGPDIQLEILNGSTTAYSSSPNRYVNSLSGPYTFDIDPPLKYIPGENEFTILINDVDSLNSKEIIDSFLYFSPTILYSPWSVSYIANSRWTFVVTYQ